MLLFMDGGSAISIKYSIMSDVCKTATTKACARCKTSYFCKEKSEVNKGKKKIRYCHN